MKLRLVCCVLAVLLVACTDGKPVSDQGCDATPGYCVSRAQGCAPGAPPERRSDTPAGTTILCGCDGRTYASSCPSVRYAHTGACSP
ncbi:MAG: hypothetical protein IPN17_28575 [Deltaproteobacteria bacterium]|nr:hypothetical protein [Deltaproteobacteria bacterium]